MVARRNGRNSFSVGRIFGGELTNIPGEYLSRGPLLKGKRGSAFFPMPLFSVFPKGKREPTKTKDERLLFLLREERAQRSGKGTALVPLQTSTKFRCKKHRGTTALVNPPSGNLCAAVHLARSHRNAHVHASLQKKYRCHTPHFPYRRNHRNGYQKPDD